MENTVQLLNRIELTGVIGNVHRFNVVDRRLARVSVCTTYAYQNANGAPAIDTVWHLCLVKAPDEYPDFIDQLHKDMIIHLKGRIRMDKFINILGEETERPLVIVSECQVTEAEGLVVVPENA